MMKYDYKVLRINSDVLKLINGEKPINKHTQYVVIDPKSNTLWSSEKQEFIKRFGENQRDWQPIETKEHNPLWRPRQIEISEAEDVFITYKTLLSTGYKLHSKQDNVWVFERSYEGDYVPDILLLEEELRSQKLQQKEKDVAIKSCLNRIKKLEFQQNEAADTISKLQSNASTNANQILVYKNEIEDRDKLISTLKSEIVSLSNDCVSQRQILEITTNRANHLETSLDEVTNDNHLLRSQVKSLEEKSKKKGWFK